MDVHHLLRSGLGFAGRNGPVMLLGGVTVGLLAPPLAEAARPLMGVAVFVFTLGAFLKVDWPSFRAEVSSPLRISVILVWTTFGVPAAAYGAVQAAGLDPELGLAVVLAMLAPPVGSAAAIAVMLGWSAPLALLATIVATVAAPLTLPMLAGWLTGADLAIDTVAMLGRLVLIVGGACVAAVLLRRWAGQFVAANPHAMTGVAVAGLILVAVGAMHGMHGVIASRPGQVAWFLLLAFAVNASFQVAGALLSRVLPGLGRTRRLTVGLVSGNRNVTLVWAALGTDLLAHPDIELYLAMSVFPIFVLPVLTQWGVRALAGRQAADGTAAVAGATPLHMGNTHG